MVNVSIYVVPTGKPYDTKLYGKVLSDENNINVNLLKSSGLYTIVFDLTTFLSFNPRKVMYQICEYFKAQLPDEKEYNFDVEYIGEMDPAHEAFFEEFNVAAELYNKPEEEKPMVKIPPELLKKKLMAQNQSESRPSPRSFFETLADDISDSGFDGEEYDDDYYDDDDDEYDEYDPGNYFENYAYGPDLKKVKRSRYESSNVWNKSKNIKRSINRHGVVISSKDNMRRDKKVIKKFLKDFIPGDAGWKKEFREELAKRWLSVYAVSKKNLKELEKHYRKKRDKTKSNRAKKVINFAQSLFDENAWNNPNK